MTTTPPVRFNWEVSIGHVVSVLAMLLTALSVWLNLQFQVADQQKRIEITEIEVRRAHDRLNAKDVTDAEMRQLMRASQDVLLELRSELRRLNDKLEDRRQTP